LKIMSIMAHQDDFEFEAGGLFALLKKHYGDDVEMKIVATSRGAFGHHEMEPEQTFRRREKEAMQSAAIIGASYECLKCLDGFHVNAQVLNDRNLLGGLWNTIRSFEPDYIFCPPVVSNPLAGIHIDHYNTACAVRMVAYQLGVPNAYPTIGGLVKKKVISPAIINVYDTYANENTYHAAVNIAETFDIKTQMALCHESQIFEWLPWVGGEKAPTKKTYGAAFMKRHVKMNENMGFHDSVPREFFMFTGWGRPFKKADFEKLFLRNTVYSKTCKNILSAGDVKTSRKVY
ncbi:MAG: PIG-L family deacetylase, partial [Verrucomicrobia bacterium]|nr:PIG-L family deacetylase [Verrucomicrobiota bacterium]MBU1857885.1 PIG-L family deacetylase [Verrucomicrobiota bacterium]